MDTLIGTKRGMTQTWLADGQRVPVTVLDLGPNTVVVVDEAGMVGTRHMCTILSAALTAGARMILVGDDRQLQSIEAGCVFASLVERHHR